MAKEPAPTPMKKTYDRTSPSGMRTAPDQTIGGKVVGSRPQKGKC